MILHLVKCEMCTNQFDFHVQMRPGSEIPDPWFTVFQGPNLQAQEGWQFCSPVCLEAWAKKQVQPEPPQEPASPFLGGAE